jgi:hypothetical protein
MLLRDVVKRVRRRAAVVPFEVLPPPVLDRQITALVDEAYLAAGDKASDPELGAWASDASYSAHLPMAPEHGPESDPQRLTTAPRLVLMKSLTPNDVGATGSHQSGIAIPKSAAAMLPTLDPVRENPRVEVTVTDMDSGGRWACTYMYYNSRRRGTGTRDEYRLTSTTGMLKALDARVGDRLLLWAAGDASLPVQVVHGDNGATNVD